MRTMQYAALSIITVLNVCIVYIICYKDLFSNPVLLCSPSCIVILLYYSLIVSFVKLQLEN